MTTVALPDVDDPPMATACPMYLIAAVSVEVFRNQEGTIIDRKIAVVLDCGCRRFFSLPLTVPAPRPGEPACCWGQHET